jgi:hypothetical protein
MTAMSATAPPNLELPPGARLLTPRETAKRMGITAETATRLMTEGNLVAFTTAGAPAQVHISPAERYTTVTP